MASSKERNLVVRMTGRGEIARVSYEDAPLAAIVPMRNRTEQYRYFEGRLYKTAPVPATAALARSLESRMLRQYASVCFPPLGKPVAAWPTKAAAKLASRVPFDYAADGWDVRIDDATWEMMLPSSQLGVHEHRDIAYWSAVAENHIAEMILIGDDLWLPVTEPVLFVTNAWRSPEPAYVSSTIYDEAQNHAKRMSLPFRMVGLPGLSALPFWKNDARAVSLLRFDEFMDSEIGQPLVRRMEAEGELRWLRPPEIHIPSAFSDRHEARELDRAARIVMNEVFRASKYDCRSVRDIPPLLKRQLQDMRSLLVNDQPSDDECDALARDLVAIGELLSDTMNAPAEVKLNSWKKRAETLQLIDDVVKIWSDREISLDFELAQHRKTGFTSP